MTQTYTVTGDLATVLPDVDPSGLIAFIEHNVTDGFADVDNNKTILPGAARIALTGTTFSVEVIGTGSTGTDIPDPSALRYTIRVNYLPPTLNATRQSYQTWTLANFAVTADSDISDLLETADPPISSASALLAEMEAVRDEVSLISGLTGEDEAVAALVGNPASATGTALSAAIATDRVTNDLPADGADLDALIAAEGAPVASVAARTRSLTRGKGQAIGGGTGITVTIQTAAGSGDTDITTATTWGATTYGRFTMCGSGAAVNVAGAAYKGPRARASSGGDAWCDDSYDIALSDGAGTVELMTQIVQSGRQYARLYADGVLVLDWTGAYSADQRYRIKLVFDAARSRTVHLRLVSSLGVINAKTGPNGIAWVPTHPLYAAKVIGIGDSYMVGSADNSYTNMQGGYFRRLTEQFRLDGRRVAYSSTGLTTNGGGGSGKNTYLDRVAEAKTVNGHCDAGLLQLSTNDSGASQATIETAMTTFVTNWRTQFTRADGTCPPILVIGVARNVTNGPNSTNANAIDNGATTVMNANPDLFPLPLVSTSGWWTGDGYIGHAATTTPKGTAETGIAADGLHPSDVGHDYMADRIAPYLATFLATIAAPVV